mmetsp:Transcript_17041/g.35589  ORF Transcript_17041/g.35589 Transcript_17041/m.35589 type:complete len:217 (-) Transcript_17041:151-801(-)
MGIIPCSIHLLQLLHGPLRPDQETAKVAARRKLQQVQAGDVGSLNTWDVAKSAGNAIVFSIDHKWSLAHLVPAVAHLAPASTDLLGVNDTLEILCAAQLLQRLHRLLCLCDRLQAIGDDQRQLRNLADAVAVGHDQGRQGARRQTSDHCVALLRDVDAAVPPAPDPGWGEHATSTRHIAEGTLTSAVGAATRHTRNSGHCTSCAPGLCRCVVAGLL